MWKYCPEYAGAEIIEQPHPEFLPDDYPVFLQKFIIDGQTGTYIETKAHIDNTADPVTSLPLSNFMRPVVVVDVGWKTINERITVEDLEDAKPDIRPGDAVLICTGWSRKWNEPDFVEGSPFIGREAGLWLIDKKPAILGSDLPRFDYVPAMEFPWDELWANVPLIMGPCTNLKGLNGRCGTLVAFPLKIRGACASPCRAAIILE